MTDGASLGTTALIATALVPVVSLVKRPGWSPKLSYAVGIIAAMLAAVGGAVMDGGATTVTEWIILVLTALGTSQSIYTLYFADTDINKTLSEK